MSRLLFSLILAGAIALPLCKSNQFFAKYRQGIDIAIPKEHFGVDVSDDGRIALTWGLNDIRAIQLIDNPGKEVGEFEIPNEEAVVKCAVWHGVDTLCAILTVDNVHQLRVSDKIASIVSLRLRIVNLTQKREVAMTTRQVHGRMASTIPKFFSGANGVQREAFEEIQISFAPNGNQVGLLLEGLIVIAIANSEVVESESEAVGAFAWNGDTISYLKLSQSGLGFDILFDRNLRPIASGLFGFRPFFVNGGRQAVIFNPPLFEGKVQKQLSLVSDKNDTFNVHDQNTIRDSSALFAAEYVESKEMLFAVYDDGFIQCWKASHEQRELTLIAQHNLGSVPLMGKITDDAKFYYTSIDSEQTRLQQPQRFSEVLHGACVKDQLSVFDFDPK